LTPYQPVDLTNQKPNKSIQTAKQLEIEAKNLADILGNAKNDWSKRLKAIQFIQACFVTHDLLRMP